MTQRRIHADAPRTGFLARVPFLALALLVLPLIAVAQVPGAPTGNPRLASLNIEIWPEYDRPAALVILKGVLAEGVKLPAMVTLRVPASSGGAAAVAFSATADGNLLNLKHDGTLAGAFVTLKFETPERFFHVEFYEPIPTNVPARSYRYVWPGDFAADRVSVVVQEPASATDISVEPNLEGTSTGQDGLLYRAGEVAALEAGKPLPITVRYTKADARPSAEILNLKAAVATPPAAAPPPAAIPAPIAAAPVAAAANSSLPPWALPLAGLILFGLLGAAFILWWWRRESRPAAPAPRVCAKCGAAQPPANTFCGNCGAKIA